MITQSMWLTISSIALCILAVMLLIQLHRLICLWQEMRVVLRYLYSARIKPMNIGFSENRADALSNSSASVNETPL